MSQITLYKTPTCAFCHMVMKYFEQKGVEYDTKDITEDADAYQEILDKSNQLGTPVLDIDGIIVVGYDREKINAALIEKSIIKE